MPSIVFLRQHGYNIVSIMEEYAGISDHDVINKAKKENLVILTFDKDYGEIIFKHGHTNPPAVVRQIIHRICSSLLFAFVKDKHSNIVMQYIFEPLKGGIHQPGVPERSSKPRVKDRPNKALKGRNMKRRELKNWYVIFRQRCGHALVHH